MKRRRRKPVKKQPVQTIVETVPDEPGVIYGEKELSRLPLAMKAKAGLLILVGALLTGIAVAILFPFVVFTFYIDERVLRIVNSVTPLIAMFVFLLLRRPLTRFAYSVLGYRYEWI